MTGGSGGEEDDTVAKRAAIMNNVLHHLHNVLSVQQSTFSHQLIPPWCAKKPFRSSFVPTAIRFYNARPQDRLRFSQVGDCWEGSCHLSTICLSLSLLNPQPAKGRLSIVEHMWISRSRVTYLYFIFLIHFFMLAIHIFIVLLLLTKPQFPPGINKVRVSI